MASTASLPQQAPPPSAPIPPPAAPPTDPQHQTPSSMLHERMDQFLAMRQQQEASRQEQEQQQQDLPSSPPGEYFPRSYAETPATSGSNSGDEDDRELGEGGVKRMGGHMNGMSSKKRRKQSKPIRLGADPPEEGERARMSSPEPGEYVGGRRYSTEEELEDGERRPTDGPLNLSSGKEEGERPSLRILGPELMQQAGEEGMKVPTSMYQGLPFGMPPFPFPFPNQPMSLSGKTPVSASGMPLTPGGRPQIFNPEAYCELCNKEFCNKYFLKTHKANKHGIYSDSSPGVSRSPGPNGSGPHGPQTSQSIPVSATATSEGNSSSVGPPTPNSQAGSPFSGAFIAANMGSLRPPFLPLSPGASPSPTSSSSQVQSHNKDAMSTPNGVPRDTPSRDGSEQQSPRHPMRPSSHSSMVSPREGELKIDERPKDDEIRRSIESPRSLPGLPPHFASLNPLMFGGLPSLDSLRNKDDDLRLTDALGQQRPIPHIPNIPSVSGASGGPMGGPSPKGPFTPEKLRQMGVINADAFCEICCKEFCNKYFLRVHKLKKHGICSPDLPPEKVQKILNQMAKEAGKTGNPPPPIIRPSMVPGTSSADRGPPSLSFGPGGLPPGLRAPGPPPPMGSVSNGIMQLPPLEPLLPQSLKDLPQLPNAPMLPKTPLERSNPTSGSGEQEVIRINDDSEDGEKRQESSNGDEEGERKEQGQQPSEELQRLQSMIMELNTNKDKGDEANTTACKICKKDMENVYFLRAHMMNEHGVLHVEEPPALPVDPNKVRDDLAKPPSFPFPLLNGNGELEAPPPAAMAAANDLAAKFLQQMQKGLPGLQGDELNFLERVKSELAGSPKKMLDKDPNRKPASLSRSYCEICKKELCNKYFMKTHMMKMHGINIEATNQTGVSCHLCKKELCSKYFLKVHLQNSHGIMEDGSPVPPHLKENGGGGLFPGLFPPPPDMLGLPGSPDKDRYFSRLLGEQSEISRERLKELERHKQMLGGGGGANGQAGNNSGAGHTCSLCGEGFPEVVALQVHIIKSHGAFPPESGVFGSLQPPPRPGSTQGSEEDAEKTNQERGDRTDENSKDGGNSKDGENESAERGDETGDKDRGSSAPTPTTSMPSSFPFPNPLEGLPPGLASEAAKNFPHIEMLQRHMLSAQFPGLINPLLAGFPGLPGNGSPPFPNPLQQLLAGGVQAKQSDKTPPPASPSPAKKVVKKAKRKFKCSKCQLRFRRRESCLKHIQKTHSVRKSAGKHLRFVSSSASSPLKRANNKSRSQYVKQLMELLRVPTSRGTPHSPDAKDNKHIMQPFLLKTPKSSSSSPPRLEDVESTDAEVGVAADINFVPSLVYLPVAKRVSQPMTVSFSLTPA